jgi:transcriptional regulator with XRE-family HTH domain
MDRQPSFGAGTAAMSISHGRQFPPLLEKLKLHLKAQGLRQRDIAQKLGVGLATVKRWLAGDGLTTQRLEELCDLAKIDLIDLVIANSDSVSGLADEFTPTQERALAANAKLFFVFFSLLNGLTPEECQRELQIPATTVEKTLQQLARLGLIDITSRARVRVLTARNVAWRKDGPLSKYWEPQQSFVDIKSGTHGALYMSNFVRLTEAGEAQVRHLMHELRDEIDRIARSDRYESTHERTWHGVLFLVRPLNMGAIRASLAKSG